MTSTEEYKDLTPGSDALIERIVTDHLGWATSIAKSVARSWNMDWQLDGLDGGAYEGLLFCARRFDPSRGVPFRGYARRRIHEACTEEARKSKSWQRGTGTSSQQEQDAREVSAKLFDVFPELRSGYLPGSEDDGSGGGGSSGGGGGEDSTVRGSVRQLLAGASLLAAFQESGTENPEIALEYKRLITAMASLEPVHQLITWCIYYKGQSMRSLAEEWEIDDLSVIREHREILKYLCGYLESTRGKVPKKLKVRRGLRTIAQQMRRKKDEGPFASFAAGVAAVVLLPLVASELPGIHGSVLRYRFSENQHTNVVR